jgi:hypothetical protein
MCRCIIVSHLPTVFVARSACRCASSPLKAIVTADAKRKTHQKAGRNRAEIDEIYRAEIDEIYKYINLPKNGPLDRCRPVRKWSGNGSEIGSKTDTKTDTKNRHLIDLKNTSKIHQKDLKLTDSSNSITTSSSSSSPFSLQERERERQTERERERERERAFQQQFDIVFQSRFRNRRETGSQRGSTTRAT